MIDFSSIASRDEAVGDLLEPQISESNAETLETLRDIEAYFRKEAAYESENLGAGGSTIALGRWKRYYTTLENVVQDLPELITHDKEHAVLLSDRRELVKYVRELQGRWVPWKPGDVLPEGPREYLANMDDGTEQRMLPRRFSMYPVRAYWSVPLPPPYSPSSAKGQEGA